MSQITYPFVMKHLPNEFVKKAEEELNDTKESREANLMELRQLVENERSFKNLSISDEDLLLYLRGRKFNVQRALKSLKALVEFARKHKHFFEPITPSLFEICVTQKMFSFLPCRDKDGCAILAIFMGKWPVDLPLYDAIRFDIHALIAALTYPMTQVNGIQIFFDFTDNHLQHLRYCTPYHAYLMYHVFQEIIPMRIKSVHILNPSLIFRTFYPLIFHFIPRKLRERIIVHRNAATLQNHFPVDIIPRSLGGRLKDYDISEWMSKVESPLFVRQLVSSNGN